MKLFIYFLSIFFVIYIYEIQKNKINALSNINLILTLQLSTLALFLFSITTLIWWRNFSTGSILINSYYIIFLMVFTFVCLFSYHYNIAPSKKIFNYFISLFFLLYCFNLSMYGNISVGYSEWHHWSAYIGPSELFMAGAKPYYDFPIQYGLGSTLLISSFAYIFHDTWVGFYYVVALMQFLLFISGLGILMLLFKNTKLYFIFAISYLLSISLWATSPVMVSSATAFPSTGGLRFLLPVFYTYILLLNLHNLNYNKPLFLLMCVICQLWSIEAAWTATLLYSGFLYINSKNFADFINLYLNTIIKFIIIWLAIFFLYYTYYGVIIDVTSIWAYALYTPGRMDFNMTGTLWYMVSIYILMILYFIFSNCAKTQDRKSVFLLSLLLLGAASYTIGRSHDNNILNLMPYICLLVCGVLGNAKFKFPPTYTHINTQSYLYICAVVLFLPIGIFPVLFGYDKVEGALFSTKPLNFNARRFFKNLDPFSENRYLTRTLLRVQSAEASADLELIFSKIQATKTRNIMLFDTGLGILGKKYGEPFVAYHSFANYFFLPKNDRLKFLRRTAFSLNKAGWAIFQNNQTLIYNEITEVYDVVSRIEGNNYAAAFLKPKRNIN